MTTDAIPVGLRVHLTHATLQAIADEASIDLLHIKGPALDAALRPTRPSSDPDAEEGETESVPRMSTDADVLVRPSQVDAFMDALDRHGWTIITHFATGSAFEHAATLWHTELGYVDVHRRFPGITVSPAEAFEHFQSRRQPMQIAHRQVWVPCVDDQRLLLVLHAARGGGLADSDVQLVWVNATEEVRERTRAIAAQLDAEVALAAATGQLEDYSDDPTYELWKLFSLGNSSRLAEWRARIKAEPTRRGRVRLMARSFLVNTDHLAMELKRPPTRREIAGEYVVRVRTLGTEMTRLARKRLRRPGGEA